MRTRPFSWNHRIKSFRFAFDGIRTFITKEHNAWLHAGATVLVLIAAAVSRLNRNEWLAIVFVIGLVWIAEAFNTCVERMMDFISKEKHAEIRFIKDLSAGGVLIAAIVALITALIIFIPKFI